jgi:hypothetical protein
MYSPVSKGYVYLQPEQIELRKSAAVADKNAHIFTSPLPNVVPVFVSDRLSVDLHAQLEPSLGWYRDRLLRHRS